MVSVRSSSARWRERTSRPGSSSGGAQEREEPLGELGLGGCAGRSCCLHGSKYCMPDSGLSPCCGSVTDADSGIGGAEPERTSRNLEGSVTRIPPADQCRWPAAPARRVATAAGDGSGRSGALADVDRGRRDVGVARRRGRDRGPAVTFACQRGGPAGVDRAPSSARTPAWPPELVALEREPRCERAGLVGHDQEDRAGAEASPARRRLRPWTTDAVMMIGDGGRGVVLVVAVAAATGHDERATAVGAGRAPPVAALSLSVDLHPCDPKAACL